VNGITADSRGIDHADQPCEHELLLDALVNFIAFECGCRQRAKGNSEGA
jgi:hypothetical protein